MGPGQCEAGTPGSRAHLTLRGLHSIHPASPALPQLCPTDGHDLFSCQAEGPARAPGPMACPGCVC